MMKGYNEIFELKKDNDHFVSINIMNELMYVWTFAWMDMKHLFMVTFFYSSLIFFAATLVDYNTFLVK